MLCSLSPMEIKSSKTMFLYYSFTPLYLLRGALLWENFFHSSSLFFQTGTCGVKPPLQTNTPIYGLTSKHTKLLHVIQSLQSRLSNWQPIRCRPQASLAWVRLQKVPWVETAWEQSFRFWKWKQGPQHEDKARFSWCAVTQGEIL